MNWTNRLAFGESAMPLEACVCRGCDERRNQ
jgi:hypothetical protein